ncbi:hypothetical protein GCM10023196_018540 [Actinoallomurus vinaceus]|uniref:Secreted protein n=1 Tax=Actinoallomurus vinaceus TaxID=1080074 RepID=A0ABP8U5F5_9ACTN
MRLTLRKTALVATAAVIGLATASLGGTAEAAAKVKPVTVSCTSKQGDKGTLYVYKASWGIYQVDYRIKLKGYGKRTANDIQVRDEGGLPDDEKYSTGKAWSDNKVHRFHSQQYGRSFGYYHVKFIFDIPKKKDHWCTTKKVI